MNRHPGIGLALACILLTAQRGVAAAASSTPVGFQVKQGFRLELVAAEPLVFDPVALAFDGNGRLFVAEHRDYPGQDIAPPQLGRVRLLEDSDGDGRYDTSRDFADDLPAPSALICWDRGVIVAAGTQILHCKDTNDDGRADERIALFAAPTNVTSLQETPLPIRSFVWGLDNRIHAAAGALTVGLSAVGNESPTVTTWPGQDFAFDPRSRFISTENSFGSVGVSFDRLERKFVCAPGRPLRQVMWAARYAVDTNGFVLPSPLADVCGPASAAPILPLRAIPRPSSLAAPRTEVRRVPEFFTAASSVLAWRGHLFPAAYSNDVFVADARANLIHRLRLRTDGVEAFAERPAEDRGTEFLATTNTWFRPMQLTTGPDGALYIVDLHREFLDAPARLPETQANEAALRRGSDRGRIYRIVPDTFKQPAPPRLENAKTLDVLLNLAHLNGWHRDTAARLLCERQDSAAVPLLSNMLHVARSPLARLLALAVLDGLGALQETHLTRGLRDDDDRVRLQAVRLTAQFTDDGASLSDALWSALRPLAADRSAQVRYEAAFALRRANQAQSDVALLEILRRDPGSPWTWAAVLNALASDPGDSFKLLLNDARFRRAPGGREFLRGLARLVGARNDRREISRAFSAVDFLEDAELGFALLHELDEGLSQSGSGLTGADPDNTLRPAYQRAMAVADDNGLADAPRAEATRLLAAVPYDEVSELLFALISPLEREANQLAAVQTLGRFADARVGAGLVQRWGGMSAAVRAATLEVLLARAENTLALLEAVASGRIRRDELSPAHIVFLRSHVDGGISQRAGRLFPSPVSGDRSETVKGHLPALKLRGQAARGRPIYLARCAECHRFRGAGFAFGPDLESATGSGKEWMLTRLVDPNRFMSRRAESSVVETRHRGYLLGTIENETPAGLNLRLADGDIVGLPRNAFNSVTSLGISAMPEGMERGLTKQNLADLLEYLTATPR